MIRERQLRTLPGIPMLIGLLVVEAFTIYSFVGAARADRNFESAS
jgi:hypothetical protein